MHLKDGDPVKKGDIALVVVLNLFTRTTVLNLQRMSAIATKTNNYVKILQEQKQRCWIREKQHQVYDLENGPFGGGQNHRFGLYDMIMLKDNHIDFAGGIKMAITKAKNYLKINKLNLKLEVEARNLDEVEEIISVGGIDRIMLDNFTPQETSEAVKLIDNKYETESSGGITIKTIRTYAECGVNYISVGELTHSVKNMDLSLKAF